MAKHTLEDVEKHGKALHQPFATEQAHNRELREKLTAARQDAATKQARRAEAEALREGAARANKLENLWDADAAAGVLPLDAETFAKRSDRKAYDKEMASVGAALREHADAARFVAWLESQVEASDRRLGELEPAAVEYLGKEVARPAHEQAIAEVDEALERMLDAFGREQAIRATHYHAMALKGPERRRGSERLGRYIRALGSLEAVGGLAALEHAVSCWRMDAAKGGYKVRAPQRTSSNQWRGPFDRSRERSF